MKRSELRQMIREELLHEVDLSTSGKAIDAFAKVTNDARKVRNSIEKSLDTYRTAQAKWMDKLARNPSITHTLEKKTLTNVSTILEDAAAVIKDMDKLTVEFDAEVSKLLKLIKVQK